MSFKKFNYIIIGAGASGLQLALAMLRDDFFKDKNIGIIEKKVKFKNDKTWCYWESGQGLYDDIVYKSWKYGYVKACHKTINFDLQDYSYKMIRSLDFYNFAKKKVDQTPYIQWIEDEIVSTKSSENSVEIVGKKDTYIAEHSFDSRLPKNYKPANSINILQHFEGWFIETKTKAFNPEQFCMMDYSHSDKSATNFIYILPFTEHKALVESTYFSPELVKSETYRSQIKSYLENILKLDAFEIYEKEKGIIPMSSHPFYINHQAHITKIGTSGGWVKASTGYSFKNSERLALKIINNLKSSKHPKNKLFKKRYKHYDKLFLDVLYHYNNYGEIVFYKMYKYNDIKTIFSFLDEKTKFYQDLKIMFSMTSFHFIKAFLKHIFSGFRIK
ncbi:lycopene cyclase family protein [Flavobacteriaceae bacterium 14752]|uniref:lycopene cyclase family protein n=1 Tax=Mesohalobacter salilacus TaxID=2491711 RepID=UPI000F63B8BF|nr:lycopene cyclase [Flavobacteriaceae bacterium 14752]